MSTSTFNYVVSAVAATLMYQKTAIIVERSDHTQGRSCNAY